MRMQVMRRGALPENCVRLTLRPLSWTRSKEQDRDPFQTPIGVIKI